MVVATRNRWPKDWEKKCYKERIMKAVKVVFGENQRFVPLVGRHITQEDVRAQQPDTEEYHDPDQLDPSMFLSRTS